MLHFRNPDKPDPATGPVLFQRFGKEGAIEIMETGIIDDERLFGHMLVRKYGNIVQGQGDFPHGPHRHEHPSVGGMGADARGRKEGRDPFPGRSDLLEVAGEEMHRILTGADDGDFLACLLEADAGGEARQAPTDDYGIESHTPSTCL